MIEAIINIQQQLCESFNTDSREIHLYSIPPNNANLPYYYIPATSEGTIARKSISTTKAEIVTHSFSVVARCNATADALKATLENFNAMKEIFYTQNANMGIPKFEEYKIKELPESNYANVEASIKFTLQQTF